MTPEKFLTLLFIFSWTAALWTILIGKLIEDGIYNYTIHYTDWNWTINAVFFLLDLITFFPKAKKLRLPLYYLFVWIANGSSWLVFYLIFVLFEDNVQLLINMSTLGGGKYELGFLINMNTVFHILPAMFMLAYLPIRRREITRVYATIYKQFNSTVYPLYVAFILLVPLMYIGFFEAIFDIRQIYGITLSKFYLVLIVLAVIAIMNGVPLYLFIRRGKQYARKSKWIVV